MKIKIKRFYPDFDPPTIDMEYDVPTDTILLEALDYIKSDVDASLTYAKMCRSGVCGSCAVKVNGKEVLACEYVAKDGDYVEPLSVVDVVRDLVVDFDSSLKTLQRSKSFLLQGKQTMMSEEEEKYIEQQSDCILCHNCYSSCPVYETNGSFLGPFALSRSYRYLVDVREEEKKEHIDAIVKDGIWDCTLCGNCTAVCPQKIDPKNDILMLQSWASKFGYTNPHLSSFGSFGLDF